MLWKQKIFDGPKSERLQDEDGQSALALIANRIDFGTPSPAIFWSIFHNRPAFR
jgi:hypothetical protein